MFVGQPNQTWTALTLYLTKLNPSRFCMFYSNIKAGYTLHKFSYLRAVAGHYLSMFPLEPRLGKMLVMGAVLNCVDPILTVVAGLSVRNPFLAPLEKKEVN